MDQTRAMERRGAAKPPRMSRAKEVALAQMSCPRLHDRFTGSLLEQEETTPDPNTLHISSSPPPQLSPAGGGTWAPPPGGGRLEGGLCRAQRRICKGLPPHPL